MSTDKCIEGTGIFRGCYVDSSDRVMEYGAQVEIPNGTYNTIEYCIVMCKDAYYQYAGMEVGSLNTSYFRNE